MNGVGVDEIALDDMTGSPIESEQQWNIMGVGGSKGIFKGASLKNVINVDFTEAQGYDIQLRLSDLNVNLPAITHA